MRYIFLNYFHQYNFSMNTNGCVFSLCQNVKKKKYRDNENHILSVRLHTYWRRRSYPCNRPWKPMGLWDVEAPTFSLDNRLTDGGKFVSLTRRPPLPPGRFMVFISVRGWVEPSAIVRLEGLGKLTKIHLIGTRTRDFMACSTVPQQTTHPLYIWKLH
jgi:hypothetical protein